MDTTTSPGERLTARSTALSSTGVAVTAPVPSFGVIVCEPDRSAMLTICDAVDQAAGLYVIAACTVGVQALELVRSTNASAIVLASETTGISGYDIALELHRSDPAFPIVLVTHDREARQVARRHGLFGGVYRFRFAELTPLLDRLHRYLDSPDRSQLDRRAGEERRRRQVWGCVTRQRRTVDERRTKDLPPESWPVNQRYS